MRGASEGATGFPGTHRILRGQSTVSVVMLDLWSQRPHIRWYAGRATGHRVKNRHPRDGCM